MKNKTAIIISSILAAVVTVGGIGFWLWQKQKADKIKADTIVWEIEGYKLAVSAFLPGDKFNYELEKSKTDKPLPYPYFRVSDRGSNFKVNFSIDRISSNYREAYYNSKKKEKDFKDIVGDSKKGALSGYSYDTGYGYKAILDLVELDNYLYRINLLITDSKNAKENSKAAFEYKDTQDLIASIRLVKDYKAPERDYITNHNTSIVIKKSALKNIEGYQVKYEPKDSITLAVDAEKTKTDKVSLEFFGIVYNKSLEKAIADDYEVKSGKRSYSAKKDIGEYKVATDPKVSNFGIFKRVYFFATDKNNQTIKGAINFAEDNEAVANALITEILNHTELKAL